MKRYLSEGIDYPVSVFAADINSDGNMDILGAGYFEDYLCWWENDDSTGVFWKERPIRVDFNGASSIGAFDIDGDGDLDVIGTAQWEYDVLWFENFDGIGTQWIEHTVSSNVYGAASS